MSVVPNEFAVSKDKSILFKSDSRVFSTRASLPRIEFIIAVNNAWDADLSRVNANSPSDAVFIAAAWAAVLPTISRFSLNSFNCSPAWVKLFFADCSVEILSLHEQRRYSSLFNWQN